MSQEQKQQQQKGDPILEGQELGIQRGKKEDVSLHISFEGDDSLIEDTERMSRKLSGERDEVVRGDVREGVETRLHTTTAEPRFNVMSTTASGAADLPDTKLGGDVKHLGESVLHHKTKMAGKETPLEPSVLDPGFTGMTANKSSSTQ